MKKRVVLTLVVAGLLACTLPGDVCAGEDPTPARVAGWILDGDKADVQRAVTVLEQAPASFLYDVALMLRARRGGEAVAIEAADVPLVLLSAEVYAGPRGFAAAILGEGRQSAGQRNVDAATAAVMRRVLTATAGVSKIQAPRLLVQHDEWARIEITTPYTYVKSVAIEGPPDAPIAEPVSDTIHEGLVLKVRPYVSAVNGSLSLTGAIENTAIRRPVPTKAYHAGGTTEPILIHEPDVHVATFELRGTIADGDSVAGPLGDPSSADREHLVLVQARVLSEDELPGDATEVVALKESEAALVDLEVRVLEITDSVAQRALNGDVPDAEHPARTLDAREVVGLLGPGRDGVSGVTIITAPRVATYDGQRANVSLLNQLSYVQDFDIEVARDGTVIANPVIGTIQEGLVLDLTPRVDAARDVIQVDVRAMWTDLRRPIPEFTTSLGDGYPEATIQLPETTISTVEQRLDIPPGGYVLLGGLARGEGGGRFVLVHAAAMRVEDLDDDSDGIVTPR